MELVYRYFTGSQFRRRIDAILEKISDMRDDLDRERKVIAKLWAKREEQLNGVLDSTAGLYGDLQGIAGRGMPEIESRCPDDRKRLTARRGMTLKASIVFPGDSMQHADRR
jgi:hypothetical protein